jgi:hypothetical protein
MQGTGQLSLNVMNNQKIVERSMLGDLHIEFYNFDEPEKSKKMSEKAGKFEKSEGRKRMSYIEIAKENDLIAEKQKKLVKRSMLMISILLILLITLILTELLYPLMCYFIEPFIDLLLNYFL